jgi:sigma-E factor negative regulatory protein RseC
MGKNSVIEHMGIVSEISDKSIFVELTVMSACSACHAKAMCSFDSEKKIIEIFNPTEHFAQGEIVNVVMRESLGKKALVLGYLMPFVVLISTLFIFSGIGIKEGVAGLLAIGMLAPYYLCLYLFKNKIRREFSFNIEKI